MKISTNISNHNKGYKIWKKIDLIRMYYIVLRPNFHTQINQKNSRDENYISEYGIKE